MAELFGWAGKILRVNLSTKEITTEDTSKYVPKYIGGKGIAYKIAWDELKPGVGPYDPDNLLMFFTGPMAGTLAPTSGRGIVCSVSPRTYPIEWFTYSNMGGNWAAELKYAGFDGVVIKGISETPVYLWINDGKVEIRDAANLWGSDTLYTQESLKADLGNSTQVACIGPAGENRVVFSVIQHRVGNAAGAAGMGAVMGAKKLKALAIRGTGAIKVARPAEFLSACQAAADLIKAGDTRKVVGAPPQPTSLPCSHACPLGCHAMVKKVPVGVETGTGSRNVMAKCINSLWRHGWERSRYPTDYIKDNYNGDIRTRPTKGFGLTPGIELESLCDSLGMSGWAYINLYVWFSACVDNGITELNGYKLDPDNAQFWVDTLRNIAYRQGIGDILADDLMRACERLDVPPLIKKHANWQEPMWGFASHRLGRGAESQPSPIWISTMLHWVIDTRDPLVSHHQTSFVEYWFPIHHVGGSADTDFEKVKATYARVFGSGDVIEPGFENIDKKVKATKWFSDRAQLKDSLLMCDWCFPRLLSGFMTKEELNSAKDYYGDVDTEAKLFAPLTGIDLSSSDLEKAGDRIKNIERAINIRNDNRSREMDVTGEWLFEYPEKSDGTHLNKELFNSILDSYYEARGWDKATGRPTRITLEMLDLKDVADELQTLGKLPT